MKTYRGRSDMDPLILNLGTRRRWVVNFTMQLLYSREGTSNLNEYEAGWVREPVSTIAWSRKNL
jgi:hypothetical protein